MPMILVTELKFDTFGHSFGLNEQINLGYFAYPITILGVLFVTNAFNLMDGGDGISGSLVCVALIGINIIKISLLEHNYNFFCNSINWKFNTIPMV